MRPLTNLFISAVISLLALMPHPESPLWWMGIAVWIFCGVFEIIAPAFCANKQ